MRPDIIVTTKAPRVTTEDMKAPAINARDRAKMQRILRANRAINPLALSINVSGTSIRNWLNNKSNSAKVQAAVLSRVAELLVETRTRSAAIQSVVSQLPTEV
jgi:hypothetical protein